MRLSGMLTKTLKLEPVVLGFEKRAEQAAANKLAASRRKRQESLDWLAERARVDGLVDRRYEWQDYFEWRFDTRVQAENIILGEAPVFAKISVSECGFEFRAGDSLTGMDCYLRWRCPACGFLSDETYVANLASVGTALSRFRSQHSCS